MTHGAFEGLGWRFFFLGGVYVYSSIYEAYLKGLLQVNAEGLSRALLQLLQHGSGERMMFGL